MAQRTAKQRSPLVPRRTHGGQEKWWWKYQSGVVWSSLWGEEKLQGHGRRLTENSEGKQVARSGETTVPPKEGESQEETNLAEVT